MSLPSHSAPCTHARAFDRGNPAGESGTRLVLILTLAMMVAEIAAGYVYNSMALLADGWHMSSHAVAMGMTLLAYWAARRFAGDARFAFGTWKIEILGSFASAVLLMGVAAIMAVESVGRLMSPAAIAYDEAMAVAVLGLVVNLVSAWLLARGGTLHGGHGHAHGHSHSHGHDHPHDHSHGHRHVRQGGHQHDLNLRSAYLHVLTDAATSVTAIVALFAGKLWGAAWLDPVMGLAGSVLVAIWSVGLLRASGRVLLDSEMDHPLVAGVHEAVEGDAALAARITDLHVWRIGREQFACIVAVRAPAGVSADDIRRRLAVHKALVHVTVEMHGA